MIIVNVMLLVLVFIAIVVYIVEVAARIRSEYRMHREMRERVEKMKYHVCKSCSRCSYGWFEDIYDKPYSYCPNCGAEVVSDAS